MIDLASDAVRARLQAGFVVAVLRDPNASDDAKKNLLAGIVADAHPHLPILKGAAPEDRKALIRSLSARFVFFLALTAAAAKLIGTEIAAARTATASSSLAGRAGVDVDPECAPLLHLTLALAGADPNGRAKASETAAKSRNQALPGLRGYHALKALIPNERPAEDILDVLRDTRLDESARCAALAPRCGDFGLRIAADKLPSHMLAGLALLALLGKDAVLRHRLMIKALGYATTLHQAQAMLSHSSAAPAIAFAKLVLSGVSAEHARKQAREMPGISGSLRSLGFNALDAALALKATKKSSPLMIEREIHRLLHAMDARHIGDVLNSDNDIAKADLLHMLVEMGALSPPSRWEFDDAPAAGKGSRKGKGKARAVAAPTVESTAFADCFAILGCAPEDYDRLVAPRVLPLVLSLLPRLKRSAGKAPAPWGDRSVVVALALVALAGQKVGFDVSTLRDEIGHTEHLSSSMYPGHIDHARDFLRLAGLGTAEATAALHRKDVPHPLVLAARTLSAFLTSSPT